MILRVVYQPGNNSIDVNVPDDFNMSSWIVAVKGDGGVIMQGSPHVFIPLHSLQHAMLLTEAQAAAATTAGMTKQ